MNVQIGDTENLDQYKNEPCESCLGDLIIRSRGRSEPPQDEIDALPTFPGGEGTLTAFPSADGVDLIVYVTPSGWTIGDVKSMLALCPNHSENARPGCAYCGNSVGASGACKRGSTCEREFPRAVV